MDYAMPVAWRRDRRGFWTKRKKTALSLVMVLAILAGIAAAFKLFDQLVPNNVVRDASSFSFQVWKFEEDAGDAGFEQTSATQPVYQSSTDAPASQPISQFPGDERPVEVKIINTNTPSRDASFNVYADAIAIRDATGNAPTDATQVNAFLSFWTLAVDKEKVLQRTGDGDIANEDLHGIHDGPPLNDNDEGDPTRQYDEACNVPLKNLIRQSPCKLGLVRGAGMVDLLTGRTDVRYYVFKLTEADTGADQSAFKGWTITFNLVFQARVPAEPEPTSALPVRER